MHGSVPTAISGDVNVFKVLGCHFFLTDKFSVRVTKIASKIGLMNSHLSVFGLFLTHKIALLSKDTNFKSHNSLKLSFINI